MAAVAILPVTEPWPWKGHQPTVAGIAILPVRNATDAHPERRSPKIEYFATGMGVRTCTPQILDGCLCGVLVQTYKILAPCVMQAGIA